MKFLEARLKRDIETLTIPIKLKNEGNIIYFSLNIDSPLYKRILDFKLDIPSEYPFKSPKLHCLNKIYHPNIDFEGHVCLKVLREGWMPTFDLNSIIISLMLIFEDPCGDDALNVEAGILLETNFDAFIKKVREYQ